MEKDTVLLSLENYNELRDFKREIEAGNTYVVIRGDGLWQKETCFISSDKAMKDLDGLIQSLRTEICELKYPDKKKPNIDKLKAMSIWQFLKWKKGKV